MRRVPVCLALLFVARANAHRLDEYLQATLISIAADRVELDVTLTPGVTVLPLVLAAIDSNHDGAISAPEQQSYARAVARDLHLAIDANPLTLTIARSEFPPIEDMREGLGRIHLVLMANVPASQRATHTLSFHNNHQPKLSAWLVNCLAPTAGVITILRQDRDYMQSGIDVGYAAPARAHNAAWFPRAPIWLAAAALLLLARVALLSYRRVAF
jgi:hypothetical protein